MESWQIAKRIAEGVVRRRKALALSIFLATAVIFGIAAYYLSKEPPRYRTTATVLLESRPDRIPLFQEFSPFRPLPVQFAILNSRSLAEGVLDNLPKASHQELIDNSYYVDYMQKIRNFVHQLRGEEPEVESPQRRALKEMQNARVRFTVRGDTGIIDLSGEASKPQVAIDIVNTYIEVLLSRTRSFNIDDARVTREFLEQQVADVRKSLTSSEEALRTFTAGHGGVKIPEQSQVTVSRLSQAEIAFAEVTANRKMIETRLQSLREKVETQKRNAPAAAVSPLSAPAVAQPSAPRPIAPPVQRLRDQLTKLETALIDLRTRYTDEHPRVVLVRDQIANLQGELATAVKETTLATPAPGAVPPGERVNFAEQVVALETSLHVLSAQEDALGKEAEGLRRNLGGLSRSESDYIRLQRDVESHRNLSAILTDRLMAARIREQGEMKVVKVIDPSSFATPAANEKRVRFFGLAFLLAVGIGSGVPGLVEWMKRPVENEDDVESAAGLPVLAVIPRLERQRPLLLTARERQELGNSRRLGENFLFNEAFHNLRVALQLAGRVDTIRTIMVTSAFPGEGKSTIVVNLGLELAEAGRSVILADTDFLRPTLHQALKVQQGGGLVEVLHERGAVENALVPIGDRMWVAARGQKIHRDTRGLLATGRLKRVLGEMNERAEFVLCDSSPVLLISDNLFLAAAVDAVILVAKTGSTGCGDLARAKAMLEQVGARVLGVVLNEMPVTRLKRYYRRYYKGYYGKPMRSEAS
jgi:tyrosine-protein kinase Etk/Wzc